MWSEKMKKNNAENHLHVACFITGTIFLIIGAVTIYNLIRIKRYNDLNSELCDMYMSECDKDTEKNSPNGVNFGGRDLKEGSSGTAADDNTGIGNNICAGNAAGAYVYNMGNSPGTSLSDENGTGGTGHTGINTEDIDSILMIKKIDLEMPVFNGSKRSEYLDRFFLITGYSKNEYGNGNYYIFGHQSRTFGYSLNRLNSLSYGDEILIYKSGEYHTYYVESITKTREMSIDRNTSETTDSIIIYTCDKSKAANKPYIKLCAGRKNK